MVDGRLGQLGQLAPKPALQELELKPDLAPILPQLMVELRALEVLQHLRAVI